MLIEKESAPRPDRPAPGRTCRHLDDVFQVSAACWQVALRLLAKAAAVAPNPGSQTATRRKSPSSVGPAPTQHQHRGTELERPLRNVGCLNLLPRRRPVRSLAVGTRAEHPGTGPPAEELDPIALEAPGCWKPFRSRRDRRASLSAARPVLFRLLRCVAEDKSTAALAPRVHDGTLSGGRRLFEHLSPEAFDILRCEPPEPAARKVNSADQPRASQLRPCSRARPASERYRERSAVPWWPSSS